MKFGFRTPSIKKSIKARTTGKIKRSIKKSVNPVYEKKGIGYIKNPEKALKNSLYHKTTIDITKTLKSNASKNNHTTNNSILEKMNNQQHKIKQKNQSSKIKGDMKLSPKTEKIIAIFAYIISTIIIGYILILVISFVIGIIKGFIV